MFPNGYNFNIPYAPLYRNIGMGINPNVGLSPVLKNGLTNNSRGGLFSKLLGIKGLNWQGLLNNASKTLGVINQAIPVVKQVGPMYNNMKSMFKIASLFKDETEPTTKKESNITKSNITEEKNNNKKETNSEVKEKVTITTNYNNTPSFFI